VTTSLSEAKDSSLMIHVEHQADGVVICRLEIGKVNALDVDAYEALSDIARDAASSRAVVLTGTGRAFSAGVDLSPLFHGGIDYAAALLSAMTRAYSAWFDLGVPVVAAINGHAIAGGAVLAGIADHRLMSGGKIGLTELQVGVPLPPVALEIARHLLGARVSEAITSGRLYSVEEAVSVGFVDEVCAADELMEKALDRAGTLGRVRKALFATTKKQLRQPARSRWTLDQDLSTLAIQWGNAETREAIRRQLAR
jgi:enoyl-CoA hydratase